MGRKLYTEDDHYSSKEDRAMLWKAKLTWIFGLPLGALVCWVFIAFVSPLLKRCNNWADEIVEKSTPLEFTPIEEVRATNGNDEDRAWSLLEQFSKDSWRCAYKGEMDDSLKLVQEKSSEHRVVLIYRYSYSDQFTEDFYLEELEFILTKQTPDKIEVEIAINLLSRIPGSSLDAEYPQKRFLRRWKGSGDRGQMTKSGRRAWKLDYDFKEVSREAKVIPAVLNPYSGTVFLVRDSG